MANNRRIARESALKMLFALKLDQDSSPSRLINSFWEQFRFSDDALGEPLEGPPEPIPTAARLFAETLVRGVVEYRSALDRKIVDAARNWSLERMSPVDLSILRLGAYELFHQPEIPARVTINEAIEIAKRYGTSESPAFVNGLLDKMARECGKPDIKT